MEALPAIILAHVCYQEAYPRMEAGTWIVVGLLFVVLVMFGIQQGVRLAVNWRQPLVQKTARLITLQMREEQGTGWSPSVLYFALFEMEDGQQREFVVSEAEYGRLKEGQQGILGVQGDWYRGFRILA